MKANPQERLSSQLEMVSGDCSLPKETFSLKRSFLISELCVLRSRMFSSHASSAISSNNVIIDLEPLICDQNSLVQPAQGDTGCAGRDHGRYRWRERDTAQGGMRGKQSKASWVHRALDWVPSKIRLACWSTLKDRKKIGVCSAPFCSVKFCIWRHCLWDFYSKPGCSLPFISVCGNRRSKH